MDNRCRDLSMYRIQQAKESLEVAQDCCKNNHLKDSINRSYYAAFYAVKAVLALGEVDFKRHKDVMAYFNKTFVAGGEFPREFGRGLAKLQQKREKSDYDDFYVASREEAEEQLVVAESVIREVEQYLNK